MYREDYVPCGQTCETYSASYLCDATLKVSGCHCPDGKVLDHNVRLNVFVVLVTELRLIKM